MDSILRSGDGRTLETAFVVISLEEQGDVRDLFGLQKIRQASVTRGNRRIDRITVQKNDGSQLFDLYFDVTILFTAK